MQLLQEDTLCNVWEWQLKCASVSFRIARLKMTLLTPCTNSLPWAVNFFQRLKQTTQIRTTDDGKVTIMSIDEMKQVYSSEVEAVLYCHEPLTRLLDRMVIAALTFQHPPMKPFLPQNCDMIYTSYVLPIDIATTSEPIKYAEPFAWDGNCVVRRGDCEQEVQRYGDY